ALTSAPAASTRRPARVAPPAEAARTGPGRGVPVSWRGRGEVPYSPQHGFAPWKLAAPGAAKPRTHPGTARRRGSQPRRARRSSERNAAWSAIPEVGRAGQDGARTNEADIRWAGMLERIDPRQHTPHARRPAPCPSARPALAVRPARARAPDARR